MKIGSSFKAWGTIAMLMLMLSASTFFIVPKLASARSNAQRKASVLHRRHVRQEHTFRRLRHQVAHVANDKPDHLSKRVPVFLASIRKKALSERVSFRSIRVKTANVAGDPDPAITKALTGSAFPGLKTARIGLQVQWVTIDGLTNWLDYIQHRGASIRKIKISGQHAHVWLRLMGV